MTIALLKMASVQIDQNKSKKGEGAAVFTDLKASAEDSAIRDIK